MAPRDSVPVEFGSTRVVGFVGVSLAEQPIGACRSRRVSRTAVDPARSRVPNLVTLCPSQEEEEEEESSPVPNETERK